MSEDRTESATRTTREELRERGWSDDVDVRRARRPQQRVDSDERAGNGGLVLTPAWIYACNECGYETRLATEDLGGLEWCDECEDHQWFEPLGTLEYPEDDNAE